jgi:hypothetical protein
MIEEMRVQSSIQYAPEGTLWHCKCCGHKSKTCDIKDIFVLCCGEAEGDWIELCEMCGEELKHGIYLDVVKEK